MKPTCTAAAPCESAFCSAARPSARHRAVRPGRRRGTCGIGNRGVYRKLGHCAVLCCQVDARPANPSPRAGPGD